jgi:hypothetical protein
MPKKRYDDETLRARALERRRLELSTHPTSLETHKG